MNITFKENLMLSNIIGFYMLKNNLNFDDCASISHIIYKLKKYRHNIEYGKEIYDKSDIKKAKEQAKKELRQYHYQTLSKVACGVNQTNITLNKECE